MKAIEYKKFDGVGAEVDFETIQKRYLDAARIELFQDDTIIKLNVRFDEVFHRCSSSEWDEFKSFLAKSGIKIKVNRWWQFWDR